MQFLAKDLVIVEHLKKHFPMEKGILGSIFSTTDAVVHAVDGISFTIQSGETFSLVGETGSGKTTTGRLILRAVEATAGHVYFEGRDVFALDKRALRSLRRDMQMIFQDPYTSLNPRMTIGEIIGEPLEVSGAAKGQEKDADVLELLEKVGLGPAQEFAHRHPHEFSGGQRQRIGIARALALKPKFVVADEPVSALDMSVRSEILNLMQDLKQEFNLTYLLIAHDLAVVNYMSDHVAVMYLGKIVELASSKDLFTEPLHPYTKALVAAIPIPDPDIKRESLEISGEVPSPIHPPQGCRFHTRCPFKKPGCELTEPDLRDCGGGHLVACHM